MKRLLIKGALSQGEKEAWMASIVNQRNKYMHAAGEMPDRVRADALLSEMHACLAVVLSNP